MQLGGTLSRQKKILSQQRLRRTIKRMLQQSNLCHDKENIDGKNLCRNNEKLCRDISQREVPRREKKIAATPCEQRSILCRDISKLCRDIKQS